MKTNARTLVHSQFSFCSYCVPTLSRFAFAFHLLSLFGRAIKCLSLLLCCINLHGAQCANEANAIFNRVLCKPTQCNAFFLNNQRREIKTDFVCVCIIFSLLIFTTTRCLFVVLFLLISYFCFSLACLYWRARTHGSGDRNQMKSYLAIQINLTVHPTTALIRRAK